mgnify:FL=1
MTEFEFGGFSCRAEGSGGTLALLFSGFDRELFADVGGILAQSCGGVTLAEFGDIDWDRDYSPWEAAGTNGRVFSGGADRLVGFLPDIVQELSRRYGEFSRVYLCGYSLGGLFALYSAAVWDFPALCGAASCSGSMWFPGWTEFLREHPIHGDVFLSLGGKEKNSPDPMMASVEEKTMEVKRIAERTAREPGGHFSRVPQRLARAVEYLAECK